jgi:phosphate/sulfate permease
MGNILAGLIILPIYIAIPAIILYFIIKTAVKNAIKELKRDDIL